MKELSNGDKVCNFTVATKSPGWKETDYFDVSAWNKLGEHCYKDLVKGTKVSVVGTAHAKAYTSRSGEPRAHIVISAGNVEFLSKPPRETALPDDNETEQTETVTVADPSGGFEEIDLDDFPMF